MKSRASAIVIALPRAGKRELICFANGAVPHANIIRSQVQYTTTYVMLCVHIVRYLLWDNEVSYSYYIYNNEKQ